MGNILEIRKLSAAQVICIFLGILFLVKITRCVGNQYIKIENIRLTTFTVEIYSRSPIDCCIACKVSGSCNRVSYKKTSKQCRLAAFRLNEVDANSDIDDDWIMYSMNDPADWIVMFQGIADIGVDVYESWVNGIHVTTTDCMADDVQHCTKNFRSRLVDYWNTLGIKQVKISAHKNGEEKRYITFDGNGSNLTSWFGQSKVNDSNWENLRTVDVEYFSLDGDAPSRRFAILSPYSNCQGDQVILMAVTSYYSNCPFDDHNTYPKIFYATSATWGHLYTGAGVGLADTLRISIRIE